jgi:LmbE family N-acetylglucosaminyl deacetylase
LSHRTETGRAQRVAVIVAHPDDEVLWCGGLLLSRPQWSPFVACLCRGRDPDRAPRFHRVLERLGATGAMADLDDGPDQEPIPAKTIQAQILSLLPVREFDLILTHSPQGEYTRHRRHEETAEAVWALWKAGTLKTGALWAFAYEDGGGGYLPKAEPGASLVLELPEAIWNEKVRLMREVYNYSQTSWEVRTTPRSEAFHRFEAPRAARRGQLHEESR